jgi:hypothetical protein
MNRLFTASAILAAGLLTSTGASAPLVAAAQSPAPGPAPIPATAAEAAPFLGDWTLTMQGPDREASFDLTVKTDSDKVVGEISIAEQPKEFIPEAFMADKALRLRYSFNYQGNPIDAVVTLTPAADGKTTAQIEFAGGAYVMNGSAAKKAARP